MTLEESLKLFLCSNCHIKIMEKHPEDKYAILQYYKCSLCGFMKQVEKEILDIHRIVNGSK